LQITKNTVAIIDYTLTDDDGEEIDSSSDGEPLRYIHGVGDLIPGLEEELEGKRAGDSVKVRVPPEKGYGERDEALVQDVDRKHLPAEVELELGMQFQAQGPAGLLVMTVVDIGDDTVRLDANHPLAGVALNFAVTVRDVRPATEAELEHGHVHGPGGHH